MNEQEMKVQDVRDTAIKLDEIRLSCPEDYFFIKGFIHGLLQKEKSEKVGVQ